MKKVFVILIALVLTSSTAWAGFFSGGGGGGGGSCTGNLCTTTASANGLSILGDTYAQMLAAISGAKITVAAGAPTAVNGTIGDLYVDSTAKCLYWASATGTPATWQGNQCVGADGSWDMVYPQNTSVIEDPAASHMTLGFIGTDLYTKAPGVAAVKVVAPGGALGTDATMTTPKITTGIKDANGGTILGFPSPTTSPTVWPTITTGKSPGYLVTIGAYAASGNTNLNLTTQGTGTVQINSQSALYAGGDLGTPASGDGSNLTSVCHPTEIDGRATASPVATAAQLASCNATTIYSYSASGDAVLTLPTAAANLGFTFTAGTTTAKYVHVTAASAGTMALNGAGAYDWVGYSTMVADNFFSCFTLRTGASTFTWQCVDGVGAATHN
jgi:hypothetical protein